MTPEQEEYIASMLTDYSIVATVKTCMEKYGWSLPDAANNVVTVHLRKNNNDSRTTEPKTQA